MRDYLTKIVFDSINYIEDNLCNKISIDSISAKFNLSSNHLQNLFKNKTGLTIGNYIKKRRLTESAKKLVLTDMSILDIAIDYTYNSQEAFTRVFKDTFHITPSKYRLENQHRLYCYCERFKEDSLLYDKSNIIFKIPTITNIETIALCGLSQDLIFGNMSENTVGKTFSTWYTSSPYNGTHNIYSLFKYNCLVEEINQVSECTLFIGLNTRDKLCNNYNFKNYTIPGGKYAIFKYYGDPTKLETIYRYIFSQWFPNSCYKVRQALDFEIYESLPVASTKNTVLIYVPVK